MSFEPDPDDFGIDPVERADMGPPPLDEDPDDSAGRSATSPIQTNGHVIDPQTFGRDRQPLPDYASLLPPPQELIQPSTPEQLDAVTKKKVTDALRLGLTERLAAQYAGLTFQRYLSWRKKDASFADAIKQAEAIGAFAWMARIEQAAAGGDWRAAAWKLQHRFPAEYGRQIMEHGGEGGGAIPVRFVTVEVPNGSMVEVSEGPDMPPLPEPDMTEEDE